MTELGHVNPSEVDYSAARPIRRFVLWILLAALALGAVWWIGLFRPRVSAMAAEGHHDLESGRGVIHIRIENEALLAVEIRSATVAGDDIGVISALLDGEPIDTGRTLPGRTSGHVVIEYTMQDCLDSGRTPGLTVALLLEAPLGAHEERRVSTPSTAGC